MSEDGQPAPQRRKLALDDLRVGQRYRTGQRTVTAEEIVGFGREFDPQPFHTDPEAAGRTWFKGLAASGWHTAAISMRLIIDGEFSVEGGIIGSGGELLWTRPVRPGDTLTVEGEILEITPSRSQPGRAAVLIRFITLNQHGETVQSFTPKILVERQS